MNLGTALLLFLAWQMLGKGKNGDNKNLSRPDLAVLDDLISSNTKELLSSIGKISSPTSTGEDKAAALFQVVTNPAAQGIASGIFGGGKAGSKNDVKKDVNDAGYVYDDNPSKDAREFFRPVENIAGVEAAHKLYKVYDNWYAKTSSK